MATMINTASIPDVRRYEVIHPLDDVAESKCSVEGLGNMHMSRCVKFSLYTLRGYLVSMGLLVGYRLLTLAGVFGHHIH
ncbi:MAG: hypothetical protein ACLQVD_15085 [Capsulimonadaceae bacterium]